LSIDREFHDEASEIYADAPSARKIFEYAASLAAALLLLGCVLWICILLRGTGDGPKQAFRALGAPTAAATAVGSPDIDARI
jgi:hypothetical protein